MAMAGVADDAHQDPPRCPLPGSALPAVAGGGIDVVGHPVGGQGALAGTVIVHVLVVPVVETGVGGHSPLEVRGSGGGEGGQVAEPRQQGEGVCRCHNQIDGLGVQHGLKFVQTVFRHDETGVDHKAVTMSAGHSQGLGRLILESLAALRSQGPVEGCKVEPWAGWGAYEMSEEEPYDRQCRDGHQEPGQKFLPEVGPPPARGEGDQGTPPALRRSR